MKFKNVLEDQIWGNIYMSHSTGFYKALYIRGRTK
jgi:hypothetical protein